MDFFSGVFPVAAAGASAVWFHILDRQCRRSPAKRRKTEEMLATHSMTPAVARGFTRGYRAMALAFDAFFVFFLGWFLTPLLPEWEDLLAWSMMAGLLLAMVFMALATGIRNYNRPRWLVAVDRRAEPGAKQAVRSEGRRSR